MPAWMTPLEWPVWWAAIARLALEHDDPQAVVAQRQLARRGEADDPGADDDDVALAWRLRDRCTLARLDADGAAAKPPIKPQLALSRKQLPTDEGWAYEPKYDGFRALAFVDGSELFLQSRTAGRWPATSPSSCSPRAAT